MAKRDCATCDAFYTPSADYPCNDCSRMMRKDHWTPKRTEEVMSDGS